MDGDGQVNAPPQPILIQGGTSAELSADSGPTALNPPSSFNDSTNDTSGELRKALSRVNFISGTKTSNIRLGGLALFFTFGIPLFILIITDGDVLFEEEEVLCCGSVLLGLLMAFIISYRDYTWNRSLLAAQCDALEQANILPPKNRSQIWKVAALVLFFSSVEFGYLFGATDFLFGLAFVSLFIGFVTSSNHKSRMKECMVQLEQRLNEVRNEEE